MSCKKGECKDCGFWTDPRRTGGTCHESPVSVQTTPDYWCGKFVPRTSEEHKVIENRLESKKVKDAKAAAAQAAREAEAKAQAEKIAAPATVPVKEPMSVKDQPQSTQ